MANIDARPAAGRGIMEGMTSAVLTQHIEMTPGVCGGKPRIAGSRIRVMDIVAWHVYQAYSIDWILERFPQLSRAELHAALAFYYDNVALIEEAYVEAERTVEEFKRDHPDKVVKLPGE